MMSDITTRTIAGAAIALWLIGCNGGSSGGDRDPVDIDPGAIGEVAPGVLIGEAEDGAHQSVVDDWSERSDAAGYHGSGYLVWKHGSTGASQSGKGQGVIHYPLAIGQPGTYTLKLRMRKTPAAEGGTGESDKHNDAWVGFIERPIAFGDGTVAAGDSAKMYGGGMGAWQWGGKIDVHDHPHAVPKVTFPTAGSYTLVISGRSNLLQLDRWALVHQDATGVDLDQPLAPKADG